MAYSTLLAAALSGASQRQLSHWRKGDGAHALLVPEISGERPIRYSFADLVALRLFVALRESVSLQEIRKAVQGLRELGNTKHLSQYSLVSQGKRVLLLSEPDTAMELSRNRGQMLVSLRSAMGPFTTQDGRDVVDLRRPRPRLSVNPQTQQGFPVIRGTRVPFDRVAGLIADGVPAQDISAFYPRVTAAAAADAYTFSQYVDKFVDGGAVSTVA